MHNVFLLARRAYQKMSDISKIFKTHLRYVDLCMVEQWVISGMELASPITRHHFIVLLRTAFSSWHKCMPLQGK